MAAEVPASDIQNMTSKDRISEDTMKYLREKRVPELMEYILRSIIQEKPNAPAAFIHDLTSLSLPPHIMIAGPPVCGKGTQAHQICAYFKQKTGRKPVHISSGDLLREEIAKGTNLGLIADGYMKAGRFVPDSLIIGIIRKRLQEEDAVMNGWLLDGFPRTREQAAALDLAGFAPDLFLVMDIADEFVLERVDGRRVDPATGTIYHLKYCPPPEDDVALLDRLEQRDDDNREVLAKRLTDYHEYVDDLMEFYAPVTQRIDANKNQNEIALDIIEKLEGARIQ